MKSTYLQDMYGEKKRKKEKKQKGSVVIIDEDDTFISKVTDEIEDDVPVVIEHDKSGRWNGNSWVSLNSNDENTIDVEDDRNNRRASIAKKRRRKSPSPSPSPTRKNNESNNKDSRISELQSHDSISVESERVRYGNNAFQIDLREKPDEATIYRDKFGRKVDLVKAQVEKDEFDRIKEEETQERLRRGRGLKQLQDEEKFRERVIEEKSSKFSYYKDDKELNDSLKDVERFDDPMAAYFNNKKKKKKSKKEKGYIGHWEPNRFNIPPGASWDGVDRGNGFEARYFQAKNMKQVSKDDAYKWSTEDM